MISTELFFLYIVMPGMFIIMYVGIWNNWVYLDKKGFCTFRPSLWVFTKMMFINTFRFCLGKRIIPFIEVVPHCET